MVTKRRDAVYGLKLFSAITLSYPLARPAGPRWRPPEQPPPEPRARAPGLKIIRVLDHLFAGRQLYVRLLPVAPVTFRAAAAAKLSVKNSRAHPGNFHLENLLDRFLDLRLRRGHGHFKHHGMLRLLHPETLLGDDGPANHLKSIDVHRLVPGLLPALVLFHSPLFLRGLFHRRSFFLGNGLGSLWSRRWLRGLNIDDFRSWSHSSRSQRRSQAHSRLFR